MNKELDLRYDMLNSRKYSSDISLLLENKPILLHRVDIEETFKMENLQ